MRSWYILGNSLPAASVLNFAGDRTHLVREKNMDTKLCQLEKQLRLLKAYAALSMIIFGALIFMAARNPSKNVAFDEIDTHKINILEANGKVRLVISNSELFPGGTVDGVELKSRVGTRGAGLLFYNDDGDEDGGLVWGGKTKDGKPDAFGTIRFDHYKQNEAIGMSYGEEGGKRESGFEAWDQPTVPLSREFAEQLEALGQMKDGPEKTEAMKKLRDAHPSELGWTPRLFLGRTKTDDAALILKDTKGRPRIRIAVDSANVPSLQFLDENGKVTAEFPQGK
jgi:hypothetical protein